MSPSENMDPTRARLLSQVINLTALEIVLDGAATQDLPVGVCVAVVELREKVHSAIDLLEQAHRDLYDDVEAIGEGPVEPPS